MWARRAIWNHYGMKQKYRRASPGEEKHPSGRELSPALLHALNHPVRRQILRLLHRGGRKGLSPSDMTTLATLSLPNVSYHSRCLCEQEIVRLAHCQQVRGATERFYVSNVSTNKLVATILELTKKDDGFLQKRRGR